MLAAPSMAEIDGMWPILGFLGSYPQVLRSDPPTSAAYRRLPWVINPFGPARASILDLGLQSRGFWHLVRYGRGSTG